METLGIGLFLLIIMLLFLSGGIWIAMTLAICGWVGQAFFVNTQPGKNLFSAFWETNASWELAALPLFIWMGEILFRTKLSEEMFEGIQRVKNKISSGQITAIDAIKDIDATLFKISKDR